MDMCTNEDVFLVLKNTPDDVDEDVADPEFVRAALALVQSGHLPASRLSKAVGWVVQLKHNLGLFYCPFADPLLAELVGAHSNVNAAGTAVRQSLSLLKNTDHVLPLAFANHALFVGPHPHFTAACRQGFP
ncbi:hypothetical protein H4R24_001467 [Coemansia sp. RSA 988]|nr:hypothetical protein H4R24_001467 [Coemansia sp. RSA 988]